MSTFPYVQNKKLPSDLENVENGKLPKNLLVGLSMGAIDKKSYDTYNHVGAPGNYEIWQGHRLAVTAVELMIKAAAFDKIDLRVQGGYRSYAQQLDTFNKRYTSKRPNEKTWNKQAKARHGTRVGRLDEFDKVFQGKKYWLAKGDESPSAVPGESNHGLGIAFDLQFGLNKSPGSTKAFEWVRQNAFAFGFYWDTGFKSNPGWEDWHLTYCFGDDYGCLPLLTGGGIIPVPLPILKPAPPSKRVGRAVEKMGNRTPPIVQPVSPSWKWWVPQPIDWFDTNRANTLVPFGAFPYNPPSAI
jgi:hypothetical protein